MSLRDGGDEGDCVAATGIEPKFLGQDADRLEQRRRLGRWPEHWAIGEPYTRAASGQIEGQSTVGLLAGIWRAPSSACVDSGARSAMTSLSGRRSPSRRAIGRPKSRRRSRRTPAFDSTPWENKNEQKERS